MDRELDSKLVEDFPLLYTERHWNMRHTCMCWGFSCGNGWHDLIRELSEKLEAVIQKWVEEHPRGRCYKCGCDYFEHRSMPSGKRICKKVHKMPFHLGPVHFGCCVPQWKRDLIQAWTNEWNYKKPSQYKVSDKHGRAWRLWHTFWKLFKEDWKYTKYRNLHWGLYRRINTILNKLVKVGIYKNVPCDCNEWQSVHPRAVQVKEKFGTLSFYMSSGNDEIWNLIREAERKSAKTCEECGKPGKLRGGGWIKTLCDECAKEAGKEATYEEFMEEYEAAGGKTVTMMSIVPQKKADE